MKIFESFLDKINEDFLGFFRVHGQMIETYKNPKSIKRFDDNVRGILDEDGNLYVIDKDEEIIHSEIAEKISSNFGVGLIGGFNTYDPKIKYKQILVTRYKNTNKFYLSDSYNTDEVEKNIKKIEKGFEKAKKKNPKFEFFAKSIFDIRWAEKMGYEVNEDFVGYTKDFAGEIVEVYKNPRSIKKFGYETKGITNKYGDLYVIDSAMGMGHDDIKDYLNRNGERVDEFDWKEQVHLVRFEDTDYFYISEIYPQIFNQIHLTKKNIVLKEKIINSLKKVKKKNPKYTFVLQRYFHGIHNLKTDLNDPNIIKI